MTSTVEVTRAIQATQTYRKFAEKHPNITTYDVVGEAIDAIRDTYVSWANADRFGSSVDHPSLCIVDYTESASTDELEDFLWRLSDRGIYAQFCDIRDLRIDHVAGTDLLMAPGGPVSCVYRRAVTSEIAEKPCAGADALAEAARRGLACVIGGYRTWPCATKTVFAIMHSDAVDGILTPEERAFIDAHVPQTVLLDADSDLSPYAEKDRWIVKPCRRLQAVGVVPALTARRRRSGRARLPPAQRAEALCRRMRRSIARPPCAAACLSPAKTRSMPPR